MESKFFLPLNKSSINHTWFEARIRINRSVGDSAHPLSASREGKAFPPNQWYRQVQGALQKLYTNSDKFKITASACKPVGQSNMPDSRNLKTRIQKARGFKRSAKWTHESLGPQCSVIGGDPTGSIPISLQNFRESCCCYIQDHFQHSTLHPQPRKSSGKSHK